MNASKIYLKYKYFKFTFFIFLNAIYIFLYENRSNQYRVLIYACCDEFYSHYIIKVRQIKKN